MQLTRSLHSGSSSLLHCEAKLAMREHGLTRARLQPTKNWCRRLQPSGGGVVMVHVGKTGGGSLAQYFLSSRFRSCSADFCWCTTPEELAASNAESKDRVFCCCWWNAAGIALLLAVLSWKD